MKRILIIHALFLSLLCIFISHAYGQEQNGRTSLTPSISSPTAASLGKYGDIPVSLFTGTPSIKIPLFELKGPRLSLPIELSYHGSGVRVEEIPGWAGLGWSLNAGGVITRTVRGLPDDRDKGYLVEGGDSAEVYLGSTSGLPKTYAEQVFFRTLDGEPDQYFFNFAGRSGQIFWARDTNASPFNYKPYTKPQQDIQIEVQKDGNSNIISWVITTEGGIVYTFDEKEGTTQNAGGQQVSYTSSWYLSKIESPMGNDVIDLIYQAGTGLSIPQKSAEAFDTLPTGWAGCTPSTYYTNYSSYSVPKYLWKVESTKYRVIFSRAGRTDGGGQRLASIDIENKATSLPIKSYELVHNYFNAGSPEIDQRLRLDRIRQFGNADSPVIELPSWYFEYDDSYALPSRNSSSQDYWGYYNGANNQEFPSKITYNGTTYGSGNREPSEAHSLAGVLSQITYPTGGKTVFTFEGHQYYDQDLSTDVLGGGIRIKRIEHHDEIDPGNNIVRVYKYTENSGQSSGILLQDPKVFNIHQYTFVDYSSPPYHYEDRNCRYISRSSTSYVAPGMMQGSIIMYSRVTELFGPNGEGGKKIKNFNIPDVLTYITQWPFTPTILESWQGGRATSERILGSNDITLRSTDYSYSSSNEKYVNGVVIGARRISNWDGHVGGQYEYMPSIYMVNNGAYYPTSKIQSYHNETGTTLVSQAVEYAYENLPNQVQVTKKTETNSDGKKRITEYRYAHEVSDDNGVLPGGIDYTPMKAINMLNQPYSVTQKDSLGAVLSKSWTLWSNSTGWWRPESEWIWNGEGDPTVPVFEVNN